jgi:hypothetical protein
MDPRETARFRATVGERQAFGATPQEALAGLMTAPSDDTEGPIVIWPYNRGDAFFTDAQQARLRELKLRVPSLTPIERAELEGLVEAAFDATIGRLRMNSSFQCRARRAWMLLGLYP